MPVVDPPAEIVTELRIRLGNPTTTEVSDDLLKSWLREALRKLNRFCPQESSGTVTLTGGQSIHDLPSGVTRIRKLYLHDVRVPATLPSVDLEPTGDDGSISRDLAGLSPAANWIEAAEHKMRDARDVKLYGGDWYVEAGKLVVSPAPSCDTEVFFTYPSVWSWTEVEADDVAYENLFTWAEYKGWTEVASQSGHLRRVARLGQSTTFGDKSIRARENASDALSRWNAACGKPRVGPIK